MRVLGLSLQCANHLDQSSDPRESTLEILARETLEILVPTLATAAPALSRPIPHPCFRCPGAPTPPFRHPRGTL